MTLGEAVAQVYYWQYSNTDSFNQKLIDLYRKGDMTNKAKLKSVYPEIVAALELWEVSGDNGDDLFRHYGLFTVHGHPKA